MAYGVLYIPTAVVLSHSTTKKEKHSQCSFVCSLPLVHSRASLPEIHERMVQHFLLPLIGLQYMLELSCLFAVVPARLVNLGVPSICQVQIAHEALSSHGDGCDRFSALEFPQNRQVATTEQGAFGNIWSRSYCCIWSRSLTVVEKTIS